MDKPVLVVMAAGMGSRYGGLKQIDPVGRHGEIIIDYSIYDAKQVGFEKVVFIINKNLEERFRTVIGDRVSHEMEVEYVYQQLDSCLPSGFVIPETRKKPWGTAHAILCCKNAIHGPFAVINSDDYYGKKGFQLLYDRLCKAQDKNGVYDYCMIGFHLDNTLTDHGHVARGVCETDSNGKLVNIVERLHIVRTPDGPAYTEDDGKTFVSLPKDNLVSMNMWGFTPSILDEIDSKFPAFLNEQVPKNPEKAEMLIPMEVGKLLQQGKANVEVIGCPDRWYGVTYQDDKPSVVAAMAEMTEKGLYPDRALF